MLLTSLNLGVKEWASLSQSGFFVGNMSLLLLGLTPFLMAVVPLSFIVLVGIT
jgi:hypothetical protein